MSTFQGNDSNSNSFCEENGNKLHVTPARKPINIDKLRIQLMSDGTVKYVETTAPELKATKEDKEMFGEELDFSGYEPPQKFAENGFKPALRDINEIYEEDAKVAEDYANIAEEDDEIFIEGLKGKLEKIEAWEQLEFNDKVMENIKRARYLKPRPIQSAVCPLILEGFDLKVQAETGAGKTAAFALPIIDACLYAKNTKAFKSLPGYPFALILGPTRELVHQCYEQVSKLADGTGVRVGKAYGEYDIRKNKQELVQCSDIICATPGRLNDFLERKYIHLNNCKILVLDEGDKLLTHIFRYNIDEVVQKLPEDHQTLFFSATLDFGFEERAEQYMRPGFVVGVSNKKNAPSRKVTQEFVDAKKNLPFKYIKQFFLDELAKVDDDPKKLPKTFIFCNNRTQCEKLAFALYLTKKINALPLSGIRAQNIREDAFQKFRNGEVQVLVVTDLCARGIDIKDVDIVINFDLPDAFQTYIHRIGRAGRVRRGRAINFVDPQKDAFYLRVIRNAMKNDHQAIPPSLDAILAGVKNTHFV